MNEQKSAHIQEQKKRLFFALWPDDVEVRLLKESIFSYLESCAGRILEQRNWHITLAYFGEADAETQRCLEQQADAIEAYPFELDLLTLGFWSQAKVAWLAPEEVPVEMKTLVSALQRALVPCGYTPETREYQPHITLVRKAKQAPGIKEITPIKMKVRQFCLVESRTSEHGAEYYILKRWDFKAL